MDFPLLIWFLPIVFMLHDFEEIIMMSAWMNKNKEFLVQKFPKLGKRIIVNYGNLSTASFSLAVAEEFVILVISTVLAFQYQWYILWVACFMAFSFHLIIHIVQWLIIRRYIPAIISSFISLIYSIITFKELINSDMYSVFEILTISLAGIVIMLLNLIFIHKIAGSFEKYLVKFESKK